MWYASFKAKDGIPEEVIADSHRKSGIEDHSTHAHDSLSPGRRWRGANRARGRSSSAPTDCGHV